MPYLPFGTPSAYTDSFPAPPPKHVTVTADTCFNLTVFREIVRQYRKLDDQIIIRLNRAQAELRDQSRTLGSSWIPAKSMDGAEGMCVKLWAEMMEGWVHRQTLLTFCQQSVKSSEQVNVQEGGHARGLREAEGDQLASEESIEAIIRKRTLDGK
ncbi:hypothetical protein I350_02662 [Cryptococcus amylolentus CBS 6273]|uniref:Uncharacterized protein n=1 Tax=Cryptococcus amylolentus CBS 6273 TaxID=1296118 RepID=A0A1E3K872_9TREE|nr:hypothetical protein I350_02662 [Cryptococcus amylolentus CBS 6273]